MIVAEAVSKTYALGVQPLAGPWRLLAVAGLAALAVWNFLRRFRDAPW